MTQDKCVLLDYENSMEILFSMPVGTKLNYPNEVVDYIRSRDNKTVSWVSSAGVREVQFEMQTTTSPTLERQLDYFRKSGKSLLLFIPDIYFASEIVIKEADRTETIGTTQTFSVSAYCYGVEGMSMLTTDSTMFGESATTADSNAIGDYCSRLYEIYRDMRGFDVVADNVYMPAGNWNIIVRAKATTAVSNDLRLAIHDPTAGELVINDLNTPGTSGYTYYIATGTIDSANFGHSVQVYAQKATTDTNDIYVDMICYVQASGLITV